MSDIELRVRHIEFQLMKLTTRGDQVFFGNPEIAKLAHRVDEFEKWVKIQKESDEGFSDSLQDQCDDIESISEEIKKLHQVLQEMCDRHDKLVDIQVRHSKRFEIIESKLRNIDDRSERVKDHDDALNRQRNSLSDLIYSRDRMAVEIGKLKCDIEKLQQLHSVKPITDNNLDFYQAMRLAGEGSSIRRSDWISNVHYKLGEYQGCIMLYFGTNPNDPARITQDEINATDWEIYNG